MGSFQAQLGLFLLALCGLFQLGGCVVLGLVLGL